MSYFTYSGVLVAYTTAKSSDLITEFQAIQSGFALLPAKHSTLTGFGVAVAVGTPTHSEHATTKSYVDTWTGARNAGGYRLTNLGDPTSNQDAATKAWVLSAFSAGATDPGNIAVTALGVGTAKPGTLLRVNGDGTALESALWEWKTGAYTAEPGDRIALESAGGAFTVTLPASPAEDDAVEFFSGQSVATNAVTIGRNGKTIESLAENLTVAANGVRFSLVYKSSTWKVV